MLYLGIDQHARQITISLRDDGGDVLQARQVSTQPDKINAFFRQLTRERLHDGESFVAVLEVCGFNDWLIRMLQEYRCHKVILIQPDQRKRCKTDRRDAAALSELLWVYLISAPGQWLAALWGNSPEGIPYRQAGQVRRRPRCSRSAELTCVP